LLPLPPPPQSVPRLLLPQLLHRLGVVVPEEDMAGADTVEVGTVEVDTVEVDMAVLWPVDTVWVVATALVEAFTAGWVEASVAR
jgi:hypothetical protein